MSEDDRGASRLPTRYARSVEVRPAEVQTIGRDLEYYIRVLRRRWWILVLAGAAALFAAWWSDRGSIPQYTARVLLQRQQDAPLVAGGLLGGSAQAPFGSQVEIIRSRSVLSPVVDSLGLQFRLVSRPWHRTRVVGDVVVDPAAPRGSYVLARQGPGIVLQRPEGEEILSRSSSTDSVTGPGFRLRLVSADVLDPPVQISITSHDPALARLRGRIRILQGKGPDLIWITFRDPDRQHAAAVANAVAESYRRYKVQVARQAFGQRREVITDQLIQLADSLQRVQGLVLDYQQKTDLVNPGAQANTLLAARLQTENELREMRFQEGLLEGLVARLRSSGLNEEALQRVMAMGGDVLPSGQGLVGQLRNLQMERSRLTASRFGYTENEPRVQVVDSLIASTRVQLQATAEESLEFLRAKLQRGEQRLGSLRRDVGNVPTQTAEYTRLQGRVTKVQGVYDMLVVKYYEAQIAENVETGDVRIVDPATVPRGSDPSGAPMKLLGSLMAGLIMGAVGAFGLESLDTKVRSASEAEQASELQVIGTVPKLTASQESIQARIGKEAFRGLRTNLRFAMREQPRVLSVTSSEPGEGKTTVATNLAIALVEQGLHVVIVDADMRKPQLHGLFGVSRAPGLSDVLTGEAELENAAKPYPRHQGLHVLPAGEPVDNPAELLGSESFEELLRCLEERYNAVVVDTPPVLAFTDAVLVSVLTDGTMVVARANKTHMGDLKNAVNQLRRVGAPLVGVVLNGVPVDRTSYSYYKLYYAADGSAGTRKAG